MRKVWGQASETPPPAGRSGGGRSGRRTSDDRDRRWEIWLRRQHMQPGPDIVVWMVR